MRRTSSALVPALAASVAAACVHGTSASRLAGDLEGGELLVQECRVQDSDETSRVHGMTLRLEVGREGERWLAARAGNDANAISTEGLVTSQGNIGMESKNDTRFGLAAQRVLTRAQLDYLTATQLVAPYSDVARKIADDVVIGPASQQAPKPHVEGRFQLGFGYEVEENGRIGGRFKFQAVVQPVDFAKEGLPFVLPASPAQAAPLTPPFAIAFVGGDEESLGGGKEEVVASWWEEPYFPREVRWSLDRDGQKHLRVMACGEPVRKPAADGEALREHVRKTDAELAREDVTGDRQVVRALTPQYRSMMDWVTALAFADLAPAAEAKGEAAEGGDDFARTLRAGVAGYCFTAIRAAVEHMRELECKDGSVTQILRDPTARKAFLDAATRTFGEQLAHTPLSDLAGGSGGGAHRETLALLRDQLCVQPFTRIVADFPRPDCKALTQAH